MASAETTQNPAKRKRLEIYNTVLLALASLSVAWCSFQNNLWSGIQTFALSESGTWTRKAQEKNLISIQYQMLDAEIILQILSDYTDGKVEKVNFFLKRLKPEKRKIVEAWISSHPLENPEAPIHPLAMREYSELLKKENAEQIRFSKLGAQYWTQALEANTTADHYSLFTVIFSTIMFMSALIPNMKNTRLSFSLTIISATACFISLFILLAYMPITFE